MPLAEPHRPPLSSNPSLADDRETWDNGSCGIEVRANPAGTLFDADPSNDVELCEVILRGRPGARTVSVPPWHGIDTEMGFGFG